MALALSPADAVLIAALLGPTPGQSKARTNASKNIFGGHFRLSGKQLRCLATYAKTNASVK